MSKWVFNDDGTELEYSTAYDLKEEYENLFSRIFPNLSLDSDTPQGQIISARVEEIQALISELQKSVNYFFLGGSGDALDMWAWNTFRATRKSEIYGYATIDIIGVGGTLIHSGFQISNGSLTFSLQNDVEIPSSGSVSEIFICDILTDEIALENTITQIITPLVGVDSVNNPNSSVAGSYKESDSDFYKRCVENGSLFKNSSFKSIKANVAEVSGVLKISGYENYTKGEISYKNFTIKANTFALVVLGGEDNDIAQAIADSKPSGSGVQGDVEVELEIDGNSVTYAFYRPTSASLKFSVECILETNSPTSYVSIVRDILASYVDSLDIGAIVTQAEAIAYLQNRISGFRIKDLKIARNDGSFGYSPIELDFLENAYVEYANIEVS